MTLPVNLPPASASASASGPSSGSSSSPSSSSSQPLRTTKETHPHLPPGLILDENGKVCKVCNTWQDFAKIKKKQTASASSEGIRTGKKGATAGAGVGGMAAFAGMMGGFGANASSASSGSTSSASASTALPTKPSITSQVSDSDGKSDQSRSNCPPDTAELGRSTWTFLHTTAAYYPLTAPPKTQTNMLNLLSSLSLLYPCNWCATDFQKDMRHNPPDVSGREGLMKWLCMRHNEVNKKLGKEEFSCRVKDLDVRWKDGPNDGSCD
ncbi:hypothetical protein IAT40_003709 [Kwoniella sp. CBS 6097]